MKNFNWGVIGTGNISTTFINAVQSLECSTVYGVASRDISKAQEYAKKHNINNYYGNNLELIKNNEVDAIYIATPNHTHFELIKLALSHDKHVLCEKPITTSLDELEQLQKLATAKQLFLMEGMWTKCLPTYQMAKNWIKENKIGEIQFIDVQLSNIFELNSSNNRFSNNNGSGALLDSGVYAIAFALDFLGNNPLKIESVSYLNQGTDLDSYITLHYENNKFAHIITGFSTQNKCSATIVGSNGIIEFPNNFHYNSRINLYDSNHRLIQESVLPFQFNGFEYEIIEAQSCIKQNYLESEKIPLDSSLATLKIIDAVKKNFNNN